MGGGGKGGGFALALPLESVSSWVCGAAAARPDNAALYRARCRSGGARPTGNRVLQTPWEVLGMGVSGLGHPHPPGPAAQRPKRGVICF